MTKIDEIVINFHMTEACNFKCGYCYAKWSDNYSETELHHSSSHINSLMQKLSDYFFSNNQLRQKINYKFIQEESELVFFTLELSLLKCA